MKNVVPPAVALALGLVVLLGAARPSVLPDTPLGRRAAAYFEAFNSGKERAVRAFLEANVAPAALQERPIEQRLAIYRQMHEEHGTFTPLRLVEEGGDHIEVVVRTRLG